MMLYVEQNIRLASKLLGLLCELPSSSVKKKKVNEFNNFQKWQN